MDTVADFVNTISSYKITLPLNLQIGIIIIIIIALCVGGYFTYDIFDITSMRNGFSWFIFIAILNLISILVIFVYYNKKQGTYIGPVGKSGSKGKIGKKGSSVSCNFCKNNIYIKNVRKADTICNINTYVKEFIPTLINEEYFNTIIDKGNNIDYNSFINTIILNVTDKNTNMESINNFSALMNTNSISILLIKAINQNTKSAFNIYGSIKKPSANAQYLPLGDCVYGGVEMKMNLNSFSISGNILYPSNYTNIVSFKTYNSNLTELNTYTIWRPNDQIVNDIGFKGKNEKVTYKSLGNICRIGINQPQLNETPLISEKCLEEVSSKDIHLIFIYVGNIQVNDDIKNIDYSQTDSYLIEHTPLNDIQIFSLWRTPLNTFLTNSNSENVITNNTVIFNIINNISISLNKYGNILSREKHRISELLENIPIPKFLVALILCKYYEIELIQDLIYYINRYKNTVPEFKSIDTRKLSFAELMNLISTTNTNYDKYNAELVRKASITLTGKKVIKYDETKEKHLPKILLTIYEKTNNKLTSLPVQIVNTNTLLDIINVLFINGIETRVAIDSDGIAQGGIFMNSIQEMILRICKMLLPPNVPVYTIKDECLGTFTLDKKREKIIATFIESRNLFGKLILEIFETGMKIEMYNTPDKYQAILPTIKQYVMQFYSKQGQLCGHIDDFQNKILTGDFEEFTTSRIKGLIQIYNDINNYLQNIIKTA